MHPHPPVQTLSTSSDDEVLGSTVPRLWTPPLRKLTPETSYGFAVIDFARDVLEEPLDPWQEWLVIHAGELLPDGRPRFRRLLILVARQNGKTHLLKVLSLFWLFVERWKVILGVSTNKETAKDAWLGAIEIAQRNEWLAPEIESIRLANGSQQFTTVDGCKYRIGAANGDAGRGYSLDRLILDELRQQYNRDTYNAGVFAMTARRHAQLFAITNQGDHRSIVLDSLRTPAIEFIETGKGDKRLGLFEWSSPQGSDPTDIHALAQANPSLGYRIDADALLGEAITAKRMGGDVLASFKTEVMCMRIPLLDPAVDPDAWAACGTSEPIDLAEYRRQVALCMDISLDGSHATLVAAVKIGDKVHTEIVKQWDGFGCTKLLRSELPDIVAKVKPYSIGWFPQGPAAAVAAQMKDRKTNRLWPPRGVKVEELTGDTAAVCMGLAELVTAGDVEHPHDPLMTSHIHAAQKLKRGEAWVFTRKNTGPIDAAYALAGAVHLARTVPPGRAPLAAV